MDYQTYEFEENQEFFISVACRNLSRIIRPSGKYEGLSVNNFLELILPKLPELNL